jgi:hypothetical protein
MALKVMLHGKLNYAQALASLAVMMSISNVAYGANMCSSLDGAKYCSCEYNQKCIDTENSCSCINLDQTVLPSQHRSLTDNKVTPPVTNQSVTGKYVNLVQAAIAQGKVKHAVELIEKAQIQLLDENVAAGNTSEIRNKLIIDLTTAKRALIAHDVSKAKELLDAIAELAK